MLQREHSAILWTFIKLQFAINNFVLSIFEWLFYTGFTVYDKKRKITQHAKIENIFGFQMFGKNKSSMEGSVTTARVMSRNTQLFLF